MCNLFGGTQTSTNSTTPDPRIVANYDLVTNRAKGVADTPFEYYPGNLVAGIPAQMQSGFDLINQSQGVAAPYIDQAAQYAQQGAAPISSSAIQGYLNPYQKAVTDATIANINETNAQQQQGVIGNAISKGAWGGDRAGIAQAELARQQSLANNQTLAGLNSQNYSQALAAAQADAQRQAQAAYTYGALGQEAQSTALTGANAQIGAGQLQQQQGQNLINADYSQYQQAKQYPFNTTQWLAGILGGQAGQMGGTSTTTQPAPGFLQQAVGAGAGIAGILGSTGAFGSTGWLWSDERLKENIEPIGRAFDGQMIYRYNFKGDPTTQIGFLAQEVERHQPGAVRDIDGIKGVDYHDATDDAADRGEFATGGIPGLRGPTIPSIDSYTPDTESPAPGPLVAQGYELKSITKPAYDQARRGGFDDGGVVPYAEGTPFPALGTVNGMPVPAAATLPGARRSPMMAPGRGRLPGAPRIGGGSSDIGSDVMRLAQMLRSYGFGRRPTSYGSVGDLISARGMESRGGRAPKAGGGDADGSVTVPMPDLSSVIVPMPAMAPPESIVLPFPADYSRRSDAAIPTAGVVPITEAVDSLREPPPRAPVGVAPPRARPVAASVPSEFDDAGPAARPGGFNVGNIITGRRNPDGSLAFRSYQTPDAAVAAVRDNLRAYPRAFNRGQPMSILQIAPRWSMGKSELDDNSRAWARNVAITAGIDPNVPIDLTNPEIVARIAKGIHVAEFGQRALYPDEVYRRGAVAPGGAPLTVAGGTGAPPPGVADDGMPPPTGVAGGALPADAGDDKPRPPEGGKDDGGDFMLNPWLALAAAGFGMSSSRNPTFLGALGEGGMQGVSTAMTQGKMKREIQQAKAMEEHRKAMLGLSREQAERQARQFEESLRTHRQIEADRSRRADATDRRIDLAQRREDERLMLARARLDKPVMTKDSDPYTGKPLFQNGHGDLFIRGDDGQWKPYTGIQSGAQASGYQFDPAKERTVTLSSGDVTVPALDPRDLQLDRETQKLAARRADEIRKAASGAGDAQRQMNELKKAFDNLPKSGPMSAGAWADTWRNVARHANALTASLGVAPVFDPDKVGSLDEMKKLTIQLAATATKAFNGSRPTNFDFEQMLQGTPGAQLGPEAFKRIVGFMESQNNRARDLARYATEYQRHRRTAFGVDDAFNQQRPDDFYTKQAGISAPQRDGGGSAPRISSQDEYNRLPPGSTYIDARDGKTYRKK